jgi:ligand-binding sensor domain-containing protein
MNQKRTRLLAMISLVCSIACGTTGVTSVSVLTPEPTLPPTPAVVTEAITSKSGWNTYTSTKHLTDIALDRDGHLWATTEGGAVRWKPTETTYTKYTTSDGLADNHVTSIASAPDGTLWFGTQGGVSHFDGQTWTNYWTRESISDVAVSAKGIVWVGSAGGGVSRFDGEKWTTYTLQDGLAGDTVQTIAVSLDGALWAAIAGGYISRFDGESWYTYTPGGLTHGDIRTIAVVPGGTVWIGTHDGALQFDPGIDLEGDGETGTIHHEKSGLASNDVRSIAVAPDGNIWIGTAGGIARFEKTDTQGADSVDQGWTTFGAAVTPAEHYVTVAPDGTLWAGTGAGFFHFDGETWTSYPLSGGLMDDHVTAVAIDADGVVWASTDTGVSRFDPSAGSKPGAQDWISYPFSNSLPETRVTAIAPTQDGKLWIGLDRGIVHLDTLTNTAEADSRWTFYSSEDPINALAVTPNSAVWASTRTSLLRFDGQTQTSPTIADGLPDGSIVSIATAPDGTLWAATQNDIQSFDGRAWTPHPIEDVLYEGHITSITVSTDGVVWFMIDYGTNSGIYHVDGDARAGIIGKAYAISAAADGTLWVRTADGVARYDSRGGPTDDWTVYTVKDGLSSGRVNAIAIGHDGSVWVGTENGLSRYVPK